MRIDGTNVEPRVENRNTAEIGAVSSADGKRIFFLSRPYARDLCVKDSDGTNERVIAVAGGNKQAPKISPDGNTLLVGIFTKGNRRMTDLVFVDTTTLEVVGTISDDCDVERSLDSRARNTR